MFCDSRKLCLRCAERSNILTKSVTLNQITYVRKMLRIYNAAGAPGEFFLLTSIEKRQVIYLSKLIHPTCKTPG